MAKLIYSTITSLDGYVADDYGNGAHPPVGPPPQQPVTVGHARTHPPAGRARRRRGL